MPFLKNYFNLRLETAEVKMRGKISKDLETSAVAVETFILCKIALVAHLCSLILAVFPNKWNEAPRHQELCGVNRL